MTRWAELARTWGTRAAERQRPYPCDDVLPGWTEALFRGVDVHASPEHTFRWLCQLRAAPYSYDWIDNLGRRSPRELVPELEQLAVGQPVMRIFDLVAFAHAQHLTIRLRRPGVFPPLAVSYVVVPAPAGATRLLVKLVLRPRPGLRDRLALRLLAWGDFVMMRRQLLNLKALAERSQRAEPHASR